MGKFPGIAENKVLIQGTLGLILVCLLAAFFTKSFFISMLYIGLTANFIFLLLFWGLRADRRWIFWVLGIDPDDPVGSNNIKKFPRIPFWVFVGQAMLPISSLLPHFKILNFFTSFLFVAAVLSIFVLNYALAKIMGMYAYLRYRLSDAFPKEAIDDSSICKALLQRRQTRKGCELLSVGFLVVAFTLVAFVLAVGAGSSLQYIALTTASFSIGMLFTVFCSWAVSQFVYSSLFLCSVQCILESEAAFGLEEFKAKVDSQYAHTKSFAVVLIATYILVLAFCFRLDALA